MGVTVRIEESKELLSLFKDAGKRFQKRLEKNLDIFLTRYKYRIFREGLNSASNKMKPAKLPRPKRAKNPKSKAKGKRGYLPVPAYAQKGVPPFLFRTGTLFDSIDIAIRRGAVVIKINYPTKILQGLEARYGKIFQPTAQEASFFADILAEEAQAELERQIKVGRVNSLI